MPTPISDATHLQMLKAVGADLVSHASGEFWAVFDFAYVGISGGIDIEQRAPVMAARTIDVEGLPKSAVLTHLQKQYRIVRQEPDGTGETRLILSKA